METNRLTKVRACAECYDHPAERDRCICWVERDYPTIELEFTECVCCGHIDEANIPFTEFNRKQLGDNFFEEEIKELELQARINSFTYQIDSFRTGNQVNKGEVAVRVTCIETGEVTECSEHRSRYQNIEQAKRLLAMTEKERIQEWFDGLSLNKIYALRKELGMNLTLFSVSTEEEQLQMYNYSMKKHEN